MKKLTLLAMFLVIGSTTYAFQDNEQIKSGEDSSTQVSTWVGEISDPASSHTTLHDHNLVFKDRNTGETFDVVDSPDLVRLHHETEKNYAVEIEAEKIPRFLFWGGNLVVKNFKILNETSSVPHLAPREPSMRREFGGGRFR